MPASISDRIYLDHNATTPIFPEVVEAMRACWSEPYLNPASQHEFGRRARRTLEDARDRIAELLGANTSGTNPDGVIFTSGGTESNNLGMRGVRSGSTEKRRATGDRRSHLIVSAIEHPSIITLAKHLSQTACHVDQLTIDPDGVIRIDDLPRLLQPQTHLVAAMLANNET